MQQQHIVAGWEEYKPDRVYLLYGDWRIELDVFAKARMIRTIIPFNKCPKRCQLHFKIEYARYQNERLQIDTTSEEQVKSWQETLNKLIGVKPLVKAYSPEQIDKDLLLINQTRLAARRAYFDHINNLPKKELIYA